MRDRLDAMIKEGYELQKRWKNLIEDMEELRGEMHNRPRQMRGRNTSRHVTPEIRVQILEIRRIRPDLPQHEIAKMLKITPARVSETIAGKRI